MAGEIKKLRRSEGTTVGSPTDLSVLNEADSLVSYASDAAYVAAKGSAAVDSDCYYNTTTDTARLYAAGAWTDLGSGGGGGINYVTLSDVEGYDDSAAADKTRPADGTGATGDVTEAVNSTDPLIGTQDYKLSKPSGDRQGYGWSWPLTIDKAFVDFPVMFKTKFYFNSTANFDSSYVAVYIVNVDGPTVIQPHTFEFNAIEGVFETTWQPQAGDDDYRVCIHIKDADTDAWDMQVAGIETGPQTKVSGPAMTDFEEFSVTSSYTVNSTHTGYWRRIGNSAEIRIHAEYSGTPNGGAYTFDLPPGLVIDTEFLNDAASSVPHVGYGDLFDASTGNSYVLKVRYSDTNTVRIAVHNNSVGNYNTASSADFDATAAPVQVISGDSANFVFTVPIVGWSSNSQMSNEGETRVVMGIGALAGQSISSGTTFSDLTGVTVDRQTHSIIDTGDSSFTAPVSGYYEIGCRMIFRDDATFNGQNHYWSFGYEFNDSGTTKDFIKFIPTGFDNTSLVEAMSNYEYFEAGEYIKFRARQNSGASVSVLGGEAYIKRVSGPSSIAASEVVAARYACDQADTCTDSVTEVIRYNVKDYDTHNAVTFTTFAAQDWRFTAPVAGFYEITLSAMTAEVSWAATKRIELNVQRNGADNFTINRDTFEASTTIFGFVNGSIMLQLDAGDYIKPNINIDRGGDTNLINSAQYNHIQIRRLGGIG
jgi:hypothetical protein